MSMRFDEMPDVKNETEKNFIFAGIFYFIVPVPQTLRKYIKADKRVNINNLINININFTIMEFNLNIYFSNHNAREHYDQIIRCIEILEQSDTLQSEHLPKFTFTHNYSSWGDTFNGIITVKSDIFPYWILQVIKELGFDLDWSIGSKSYAYANNPNRKFYIPDLNHSYFRLTDKTNGGIQDLSEKTILEIKHINVDSFPTEFTPASVWNPYIKDKEGYNYFESNEYKNVYIKEDPANISKIFAKLLKARQKVKQQHSKRIFKQIKNYIKDEIIIFTTLSGDPVFSSIKNIQEITTIHTDNETLLANVSLANQSIKVDLQRFAKEVVGYDDPESLTLPTSIIEANDYHAAPFTEGFDSDRILIIKGKIESELEKMQRRVKKKKKSKSTLDDIFDD